MGRSLELRPAGERAVLVEVAGNASARKLGAAARRALGGLEDVVVGHETVLLVWERGRTPPSDLRLRLAESLGRSDAAAHPPAVELPVRYDGPDLDAVAERCGLSPEAVVRRHLAASYVVGFVGFVPGFAYLVGGDPGLRPPRRDEPRDRIPAGSLAIAGEYSAIYPVRSPGGWQLIGSCALQLFDLDRERPALLETGAAVRFREVT